MIVLFTDFGAGDPYVGQMHAAIAKHAPNVPIIDLLHEVPRFDVRSAAYLLAAYVEEFPPGTVFCSVVDPGVGGARKPVMLQADGRWFVGPDNGLLSIVARRSSEQRGAEILWQPPQLSMSFHGRDLFAPVAARLAAGEVPESRPCELTLPEGTDWPDDLHRVIFIDHYGNAMTGVRGSTVADDKVLLIGNHRLRYAATFSAVHPTVCFWYRNANDLVEISGNQTDAEQSLRLYLKQGFEFVAPETVQLRGAREIG